MSLAEAIAAARQTPGVRCSIAVILDGLDEADRTALLEALADRDNVTGTQIERALKAEGHHFGKQAVQHHRRGGCTCGAG